MSDPEMPKPFSLEEQLEVLEGCGIRLCPGVKVEHLLAESSRESYFHQPFVHLLIVMGSAPEDASFDRFSNNIWHFDSECIYDSQSYELIAERFRDLAEGDLPITDINSHVDFDEEAAWLSFRMDGKAFKWAAEVDSDWVDTTVLSSFAQLLEKRATGKIYTHYDLGGQDCLIACSTPTQLGRLMTEALLYRFDALR